MPTQLHIRFKLKGLHQFQHVTTCVSLLKTVTGRALNAGWLRLVQNGIPREVGPSLKPSPTESQTRSPSACICLATSLASLEPATRLTPQLALPNLNSGNSSRCSWSFLQMALFAHARKSFESAALPPSLHPWGFQVKAHSSARANSRGSSPAKTECREPDRQAGFVECLAQQTSGKVRQLHFPSGNVRKTMEMTHLQVIYPSNVAILTWYPPDKKKKKHQRTLRNLSEFFVENLTLTVCSNIMSWGNSSYAVLPQGSNIAPGCKYGHRCCPRLNPVSPVSTQKALMSRSNRRSRQGMPEMLLLPRPNMA